MASSYTADLSHFMIKPVDTSKVAVLTMAVANQSSKRAPLSTTLRAGKSPNHRYNPY
jgi:hypothetical protein